MYRTHTCGQLRAANVNETVTLAGWVQKVRNLGAMTFIDLRDRYGITQIVVEEHSPADVKAVAGGLGREYVLQVEGRVVERSSKNPKMPTGDIEVVASKLVVLHEAEVPPFTIDVAYRYFSTNNRKFIIADTPGHEQYTRNMITGGSTANLAIILVDARTGVITQTRRHTYLVSLLGIKHVVLAVNKMDLVDFSKEVFDKIVADYKAFIDPLGVPDVNCIPLSALDGDNVVEKSDRTPWYSGPSLLEFLETVHIGNDHNLTDFRYPVQYVLRPNLDFRGFSAKVASGVVRKGDEVMALPSGKKSRVKSIVTYDGELDYAYPPMSVTLTLEDEIDVSRGEMLVHPDNVPMIGRNFEAMLVWMDEEKMDMEKSFFLKQTTNTSRTRVDSIKYKVDINTMEHLSVENGRLTKEDIPMQLNQIAHVVLTSSKELFFDPYTQNKATGSFILIDPITNNTSAVGMILNRVEDKDMHNTMELPVLDLPKLGIAPEHYEAIDKAVKELSRQGIAIEVKK